MSSPRLIWIVPESKGGIRSYSEMLWSDVRDRAVENGFEPLEPVFELPSPGTLAERGVELVHVQHEFGLFGSKIPGFYRFPSWVSELRRRVPSARVVATAHTVLGRDYLYPWKGRGWQAPLRRLANQWIVPRMRPYWIERTWGGLDGVIVHSALQKRVIEESGCPRVREIPHFVPGASFAHGLPQGSPTVVVFGYFSPEKGQDVVIRAWPKVRERVPEARLILAGGVRRAADRPYFAQCEKLISDSGLSRSVEITGFVPDSKMDAVYAQGELVVAPFRETSGSGSIAQALARAKAILASDLPLNREIAEREPGALAFFLSEDPESCAERIRELLGNPGALAELRAGARRYAERCSIRRVAEQHFEFYRELMRQGVRG